MHTFCSKSFKAGLRLGAYDEFIKMVSEGGYDTIAADICLKDLVPDYKGNWVDLKCFAISGRT